MRWRLCGIVVGILWTVTACGGSSTTFPATPTATIITRIAPTATPSPAPAATATALPTVAPTGAPTASRPLFDVSEWKTNFSLHRVPYTEIISGGPPRDGIPPLDAPSFVAPAEAASWLRDNEPVVAFVAQNESGSKWFFRPSDHARAYPLQILIWHEIVNDTVGGQPVTITFCPLCNAAIAFDRVLDGVTYDFGTTGKLRHSDLVMWDRQTESWWQQFTGEAIVGDLTGKQLKLLPASIISFAEFKQAYPNGKVLSRETGFARAYGRNPYVGYDDVDSSPFLFDGTTDARLRPMERVVALTVGDAAVAYPYTALSQVKVVNDTIGGKASVVFWQSGTASALDASSISGSRDIGATGVFERTLNGKPLTFKADANGFVDGETQSHWNILGQAVDGALKGQQLTPIVHFDHFWFAWATFKPNTIVYKVN